MTMGYEYILTTNSHTAYTKAYKWLHKNYIDFAIQLITEGPYHYDCGRDGFDEWKIMMELSNEFKGIIFQLEVEDQYGDIEPYTVFAFNGSCYREGWVKPNFDITKLESYQDAIKQIEIFETTKTSKKLGEHIRSEIKAILLEEFKI